MTVLLKFDSKIKSYRILGPSLFVNQANKYLCYCDLRNLSVLTIRSYGHDLVSLIRWLLSMSIETLENFQSLDLLHFIAYLKEEGLHANSINHRFSTAVVFYQFIFGVKPKIPFSGITQNKGSRCRHDRGRGSSLSCKLKVPHRLMEPLKPYEVRNFLALCTKYRDLTIVSLMLFCGLRSREVLSLTLQNVDLINGAIRVIGKGNRERRVPIAEDLAQVLKRYLDLERPKNCSTDFVFVVLQGNKCGESMYYAGLRSLFRRRRASVATVRANPHRFRHTFGTDMAKAGVKLPTLQKLMGHAHIETTIRYINFSMTDVHEEYQKIISKIHAQYHPS